MTLVRSVLVLAAAVAVRVPVFAQPGGMGPGGGADAARWGANDTPGWAPMTQQERNEHRDRMRAMQSYEECKTYQQQHREKMAARAKERAGKTLAQPRRDACGALQR